MIDTEKIKPTLPAKYCSNNRDIYGHKKYYLKTKLFLIDTWLAPGRSRSHCPRNKCSNARDIYGYKKVLSENKTFYD
jgi:hypothetical protein